MKRIHLIGILVILLSGCDRPAKAPLTNEQVKVLICGNYIGKYNKGTEYFEIRPDGTFSQLFVSSGLTNYQLSGKWKFEQSVDRYGVTFEPFIGLADAIMAGKEPRRFGEATATFYGDEPVIWFFRDIDYFITKQNGTEKKGQ
jgi:hypothetical protein